MMDLNVSDFTPITNDKKNPSMDLNFSDPSSFSFARNYSSSSCSDMSGGIFGGSLDDGTDFFITFSEGSDSEDVGRSLMSCNVPPDSVLSCPTIDTMDKYSGQLRTVQSNEDLSTSVAVDTMDEPSEQLSLPVLPPCPSSFGSDAITVEPSNADYKDDVCWLGSVFDSFEAAAQFFKDYSFSRGYKIYHNNKRFRTDGTFYFQQFKCSYSGVNRRKCGQKNSSVPNGVIVRRRVDKKVDCACEICVKMISDGLWTCVKHSVSHTHAFVEKEQRLYLRSGKHVNKEVFEAVFDLMRSGLRVSDAIRVLGDEVGGIGSLGITRRMVYNQVSAEKVCQSEDGDAMLLLQTFRDRVKKDANFFYEVLYDENSRMCSFFWSDEVMRSDYSVFGDVVVFDTTFRTNKYNLFCAPFIGIDNHKQNIVFAICFLIAQKKENFKWCFETFLRCMGGKMPKTIMTDQDMAISCAIDSVFVGVQHRYCLWHICENAKKNLGGLLHVEGFSKLFYRCLYYCETPDEFHAKWEKLISSFKQEKNTWLTNLYKHRYKWCPALCRHIFSAGIRSSQRSESTNSALTSLANQQMSIFSVFTAVDAMVNEWRNKRFAEDFFNVGTVDLKYPQSGILIQASKIYTRAILSDFEEQLGKGLFGHYSIVGLTDDLASYEVSTGNFQHHKFLVTYDFRSGLVSCNCLFFEERGFLCSHALRVLNILNVKEFPSQYFLYRWTKNAKLVYDEKGKHTCHDAFSRLAWRNFTMNRFFNLVLASQNDERSRYLLEESLSSLETQLRATDIGSQNVVRSISSTNDVTDLQLANPQFVSSNNFRLKRLKTFRGRGAGHSRGQGRDQSRP